MGSYETTINTLADELARIEAAFRGLPEPEWAASTRLVPVDPDLPHWTVFELAGHFDISIGLTRMLIDGLGEERPARDRTSFFINPRSETGPAVYGYAYTMVEGKTAADMPGVLAETFGKTIEEARAVAAGARGADVGEDQRGGPLGAGQRRRAGVLRAHAGGRVRGQPGRRGRGPRAGPHPGAGPGPDRHAAGDCAHP